MGCGGSSGSSKPLSQQQFVAKANAACAQADKLQSELSKPEALGDIATYISADGPILENLEKKLRLLQPPPQDASSFNDFLNFLHTSKGKLEAAASAAEAEDGEQVKKIMDEFEGSSGSKAKVAVSNLGLTECEREVEPEG